MIAEDNLLARQPASIYRRLIGTGIDAGVSMCVAYWGIYEALPAAHRFGNDDVAFIVFWMFYLYMPAYFFTEVVGRCTLGKLCAGIRVAVSAGGNARRRRWIRWAIRSSPWIMAFLFEILSDTFDDWTFLESVVGTFSHLLLRPAQRIGDVLSVLPGTHYLEIPLAAALHSIGLIEDGLIPLSTLALGSLLYFSPSRRTLLDRLSGTAVYRWRPTAHGRGFEPLQPTASVANGDGNE